jgi:hypothetical protein
LPDGLLWQDVIDQQGGAFRHPSCPAAGTKASTLAAKGDQTILVARGTLHPDEAVLQSATFQKVAEFLFYVKGQWSALLLHQAGKGRVVLFYDLIKKSLLRLVAYILRQTDRAILAQCQ